MKYTKIKVKNKVEQASRYIAGLVMTQREKTCTNMGEAIELSHDAIYRSLSSLKAHENTIFSEFTNLIINYSSDPSKGWLVIDDTLITKLFGDQIPGLEYHKDPCSSTNKVKGLSIVVIAWTDGIVTIPVGFDFWFSKTIKPEDNETKGQIAVRLTEQVGPKINCHNFLADGLYSVRSCISPFDKNGFKFIMRMHSNRVVTTEDGIKAQLKKHPAFKLQRNQRSITIAVAWHEFTLYVTCFKREIGNGEYMRVFLVSNYQTDAIKYVETYTLRWGIETTFRTFKQKLGLAQCQSRSLEMQRAHIFGVLLAFNFAQLEMYQKKLTNTEEALCSLQRLKLNILYSRIEAAGEIFYANA